MPGREVRRNERDASHGKTPSTSLKGVAGRSVKARKNPAQQTKKGGSRSRSSTGTPNERMRRRATLPHPLECSTIAVPGLSFRVRKGTGRLTWAMTTAKPIRYGRPENRRPATEPTTIPIVAVREPDNGRKQNARLTSIVVVTTRNSVPCHPTRKPPQDETRPTKGSERVCRVRPLVPVGSIPRGTSTSGLSNTCSTCGLQTPKCQGILILEQASRLDAFSGYPSRT